MYRAIALSAFVLLVGLTGCLAPFTRMQSAEEAERDKDLEAVRIIGDVTEVFNGGGQQVSGVGLVTDLEGTGGSPRNDFRTMLEKELRQRKIEDVGRQLNSPNNAMVYVTAILPAGCHKNDPIDLQVTLPDDSPATSLRGGYLQACVLRNYESTKNLDPDYKGGNRLLQGHILAVGKGPLLVGFGNSSDPVELKRGRVWEGGTSMIERPFYLVLKKDERSARAAYNVATRINHKFPDDPRKQEFVQRHRQLYLLEDVTQQLNDTFEPAGPGRADTAKATGKEAVTVRVPYSYRYNPERYLRVARLIPLADEPEALAKYRGRLHKMLLDPKDCVRAALRLEALGKDSIPALQPGLTSPEPLVRFAAAEALVYLGSTAGVEELANLAVQHANFRAYTLIALAGLNESVCRMKLQEMLGRDDAELRAGAFEALRLSLARECRNDKDLDAAMHRLGGENLQAFWLHQVAPQGAGAVTYSVAKRAQIVLFGNDVRLVGKVGAGAGDYFVTAGESDERCYVSRISPQGEQRLPSSRRLDDVLRKVVDLGGQYPEAVELLRKLDDRQNLSCSVQVLTPPEAVRLNELMAEGQGAAPSTARSNGGQ